MDESWGVLGSFVRLMLKSPSRRSDWDFAGGKASINSSKCDNTDELAEEDGKLEHIVGCISVKVELEEEQLRKTISKN